MIDGGMVERLPQKRMVTVAEASLTKLLARQAGADALRVPRPHPGAAKSGWVKARASTYMVLLESTAVNVGGFPLDAKVSSPPMTTRSVGGLIVLGGRESRPRGEGCQRRNSLRVY